MQNKPVCGGAITRVSSAGGTVHALELLASVTQFYFELKAADESRGVKLKAEMRADSKKGSLALKRAGDLNFGKPHSTIYAFSPLCTIGQLHLPLQKTFLSSTGSLSVMQAAMARV